MVLERNAGQPAGTIAAELMKSIEIAEVLMGGMGKTTSGTANLVTTQPLPGFPNPASASYVKPPATVTTYSPSLGHPLNPVITSAPPVAMGNAAQTGPESDPERYIDIDYWESKPEAGDGTQRLSAFLQKSLPQTITVTPPGVDTPIDLVRSMNSPGARFVHVAYTLAGDTVGPRVTVMTSTPPGNLNRQALQALLDDIAAQAAATYSKEKRVIIPRAVQPIAPPTGADMQRMLDRDRASQAATPVTQDDARVAQEWARDREKSVQWR